jgi:hypothetical protein
MLKWLPRLCVQETCAQLTIPKANQLASAIVISTTTIGKDKTMVSNKAAHEWERGN